MSINVTVSGNPVRISRHKMVTSDPSKAEFEKRRLMRLEQVRQQSKNIAENIRNKLKKEKTKCLSEVEKEGETKLKNWQARKLLELQNQYQEALDEIGLGHKEAARIEDEEEILFEQQETSDRMARERGRVAAEKLQIEKNEESLRKAVPIQRKKITRDGENARANVIAKGQKKKKTPLFDSDIENRVPELLLEESDSATSLRRQVTKEQQTSPIDFQVPTSDKAAQTVELRPKTPTEVPLDTRISERIRRRTKLNPEVDYCDFLERGTLCECCKCRIGVPESAAPPKSVSQKVTQTEELTDNGNVEVQNVANKEADSRSIQKSEKKAKPKGVPPKPKVTLRSAKDRPVYVGTDPVQYYDHPNRFSKSYVPKNSHLEKVDDEELVISPNILSEDEIKEKMRQRDMEAHIRGQVALEKEKLQREYRELLKKLPVLQKQERICEIGMDKEKYHMSRDRLEELEKRRQNRLDNAYEELFVRKKPTVTLPRKEQEEPRLNVAAWDTDHVPDASKSRTEQLTDLLSDLKSQKASLLEEIEQTLSKDTNGVKSQSTDYTRRRKRSRDDGRLSPTSTDARTSKKTTAATTVVSPSPRKKRKLKTASKKVIILQNTSTQTTPKTEHSAATSPLVNTPVTEPGSCTCRKDEEMCEIVIKIKEDEKPEVLVNPPFAGSVRVVTEQIQDKEEVPEQLKRKEKSPEEPKIKEKSPGESRRNGSWRDHFSHSISSGSSSSTSYLDPPKSVTRKSPESRSSVSSGGTAKKLDPRLLTYIKKLLNMSRGSIDDLTVSAASDVSTPATSVMETPTNNPLSQLRKVMRYCNIDAAELQKQLSYTSDSSSKHYNTSESVTTTSSSEVDKFKSCIEIDEPSSSTLLQCADVRASCTKKISDLTAKIEKVRAEKKRILQNSTSSSEDKDLTTTSYKELPERKSPTQEELDRQLLNIDYNYAEKLKQLSKDEIQDERKRTDDELLARLKNLLRVPQTVEDKPAVVTSERTTVEDTTRPTVSFEATDRDQPPLFLDIAKLPRLEAPSLDKKKKRPPPTKGLRGLGGNAPHELSTIIEADSQVSTKVEASSNGKSQSSDEISEMETTETMLMSIGMKWAIPTLKKTREALALSSSSGSGEVSLKDFLNKISSSTSSSLSTEAQGVSLIETDNRKTSTPIGERKDGHPSFLTDSDISSVREHSGRKESDDKFYDVNEGSLTKTG